MKEFFNSIIEKLSEIFNPSVLGEQFAGWLSSLMVILLVLLVFYLIWRIVNLIIKPILSKTNVDKTTVVFVQTLAKYSLLIVGLITALGSAGIQITAVLAHLVLLV